MTIHGHDHGHRKQLAASAKTIDDAVGGGSDDGCGNEGGGDNGGGGGSGRQRRWRTAGPCDSPVRVSISITIACNIPMASPP